MTNRRIRTYRGMRPFYFFLDEAQIEEMDLQRKYISPLERPRWLPNRNDHATRRSPFESFPDYRKHFNDGMFEFDRKLLVIHNKHTREWNGPPVNVLPVDLLDKLFSVLKAEFEVVYIRPGLKPLGSDYSVDEQNDYDFPDMEVLRGHPEITIFDEMVAPLASVMSYNEVKLRLYAHTHSHITVQGGNSHLISLFSGGLTAILHRLGREIRHSYLNGHFSYAANPPPRWLICRTAGDMERCLPVFLDSTILDGQVLVPRAYETLLHAFSPASQCGDDRMMPPDAGSVPILQTADELLAE